MNIVADIISENVFRLDNPLGLPNLDELYYQARLRTWEEAERECIYLHRCLDHLSYFSEYEPDPEELAEHLSPDDLGNWRRVVTVAATMAVERALSVRVEADIAKLDAAIAEAQGEGFEVGTIYTTCVHGAIPHEDETEWGSGILHHWKGLAGGREANLLRVALAGNRELWLDLKRVE